MKTRELATVAKQASRQLATTSDASKNETGVGAECAKAAETLASILEEVDQRWAKLLRLCNEQPIA